MPNTSSAKKELRKTEKRTAANLRIKTHVKSLAKQLKAAVRDGKAAEAKELGKRLQQAAAKASKRNVLHKNKAARITSRAAKMTK